MIRKPTTNSVKKSDILKNVNSSIQKLPVEIILRIFYYLSPKQLCICSRVNKKWNLVASSDDVWRKIFQLYQINKPLNNDLTFKKEYFKRSKEFIKSTFKKAIINRSKLHLFPDFGELRVLDVSIVGELYDKKDKLLTRHSQKLKSISTDSKTGVRFDWQKKIDSGPFPILADIKYMTFTILVPGLIKNLVPLRDAANNHVKIFKFDLEKSIEAIKSRKCVCQIYFPHFAATIQWHFCIPTCLIGLWPIDQSVAYLSIFFSMMAMQTVTERLLFGSKKEKSSLSNSFSLAEPKLFRFSQPRYATDLKCILILENIEPSETLLYNFWRSVDYCEGRPLNLIEESNQHHHLQMKENLDFKPSIGHLHLKYKNIIKVEILIVNVKNDALMSYSSTVVLTSNSNIGIDFLYPNMKWEFSDPVVKGMLTSDSSGRIYLTQFSIQ